MSCLEMSSCPSTDLESIYKSSLTDGTIDQALDYQSVSKWNPIASVQSFAYTNFPSDDLDAIDKEADQADKLDPPDINDLYDALVPYDQVDKTPSKELLSSSSGSGTTEELTDPLSDEEEEEDFEPCGENYRIPRAVEEVPAQLLLRKDPPDRARSQEIVDQINAQLELVPATKSFHKYDGYRHNFITVKEEHRFLILYNFLKRNVDSKIIIFFSTTKSTQYHAKLLDRFKFDVKAAHNGQSKEKFLDEFLAFSKQKKGILCLPDFQGNEFSIPSSVSWIIQYEPPGDPGDYIFRVGRISSERKDEKSGGGNTLIFLTPHQFTFLDYFKAAHVKFYEYELHKISNVQRQFERLVRKDEKLTKMGREAYHSYLMSYASHDYRDVYDVHKLEKELVARSFGFAEPPSAEREEKEQERVVRRPSSREENRWKPNKKDLGDTWMGGKERMWKHADRHAHLMKKERI